jgi:hypothetical protein
LKLSAPLGSGRIAELRITPDSQRVVYRLESDLDELRVAPLDGSTPAVQLNTQPHEELARTGGAGRLQEGRARLAGVERELRTSASLRMERARGAAPRSLHERVASRRPFQRARGTAGGVTLGPSGRTPPPTR